METKAILVGSLANGFGIEQILTDEAKAEAVVIAHLANGKLAEAIPVRSPSELSKRKRDYTSGSDYIMFGSGLGNGFTLFGPFPDEEEAGDFAEAHRSEDESWELFSINPQVSLA